MKAPDRCASARIPRLRCAAVIGILGFLATKPAPAAQLDEVLVTAQKRTERIQEVPLSVSSISAATLLEQNELTARDYLTRVPGIAFDEVGAGQNQVTIRGIATGYGGNPLVGITIDDVPFGSSIYSSLGCCILPELDPWVLDRIEVLRGPQGTFYGANAMGGLLKFATSTPRSRQSGGRAELDAATVAHGNQGYGLRAAYDTPLVPDRIALQTSAFYRQDPGWIRDSLQSRAHVNEAHHSGGRVAVSGELNRGLTFKLSALYQRRKMDGSNMVDVTLADTPLYGPYQHRRLSGTDGLDTHLQLYSLSLTRDLGHVSLVSLTGYQRLLFSNPTDVTMGFGALLPAFYPGVTNVGLGFQNVVHTDRWTQELRFGSSGPQHWQYLVGLFYSGESNQVNELLAPATYTTGEPLPALPTFYNAAIVQDYKQYAVFANINLQLTDQFDIAAGGRYSHTEQSVLEKRSGLIAGTPSESGSVTENPTTYSLTARDRFSKDQMLYARIASGYGTGGPNFHYPPGHRSFDPDKTVNYEFGLKTEWLDDRLVFNPTVYYIDWRKIQVLQVAGGLAYFINGGKASSKGVEMAFAFLPLSQLAITADASYDDARLTEDAPPNTFFGLSGDRLPFTAEWTAHVAADYRWPTNWGITLLAGATAAYTGAQRIDFSSVAAVPRLRLPEFATLDLRLGASLDRLRAMLFVRNVGDKRGYRGGSDFTTGTTDSPDGPWAVALIAPRTIGISFTAEF